MVDSRLDVVAEVLAPGYVQSSRGVSTLSCVSYPPRGALSPLKGREMRRWGDARRERTLELVARVERVWLGEADRVDEPDDAMA